MRDLSFKLVKVFAIEKVQSKAMSGDGSPDGDRGVEAEPRCGPLREKRFIWNYEQN